MTKKILILAYIVAVLALSGMVKASVISHKDEGLVQSAEISPEGILDIGGVYRTPCQQKPKVAINKIDQVNRTLSLVVQTELRSGLCPDVLGNTFKIVFDMKSLPLRVGSTYNIVFEDFNNGRTSISYRAVSGSFNDDDYKTEKRDFKGVLVPTLGSDQVPAGIALRNNNEVVPVVSPDMIPQLNSLINGEVHLTGYAVSIATLNGRTESPAQSSPGESLAQVIVPVSVSQ